MRDIAPLFVTARTRHYYMPLPFIPRLIMLHSHDTPRFSWLRAISAAAIASGWLLKYGHVIAGFTLIATPPQKVIGSAFFDALMLI